MKCLVFILALLLSACASRGQLGGVIGDSADAVTGHRDSKPQVTATPSPVPVGEQPVVPPTPAPPETKTAVPQPPVPVTAQPVTPQPPVQVDPTQPARIDQVDLPAKKNVHNVEED